MATTLATTSNVEKKKLATATAQLTRPRYDCQRCPFEYETKPATGITTIATPVVIASQSTTATVQ